MKHPLNLLQGRAIGFDQLDELCRGDVIVESQRREISPFFILAELVADQNILETGSIETPNEGASDETGAPSDEDLALF